MNDDPWKQMFGKEQASNYDNWWQRLSPLNSALHLLSRIVLTEVPDEAEILCVGAGTGTELIAFAEARPRWKFMAVDISADMLAVCRRKVEAAGLLSRCEFHAGDLSTLPSEKQYHAATSILVSQFLVDLKLRRRFFDGILNRLLPGGYLITADLAAPAEHAVYETLEKAWVQMQLFTGAPEEMAKASTSQWGKLVSVLPVREIETLISSCGFQVPTLFFQTLFIHAWYARAPL